MSQSQTNVSDDDWIALLFGGVLVIAAGGASLGAFLTPVRDWMVEHHLLEQGDAVVVPLVAGAGFGMGQLLVLGASAVVALALAITAARRGRTRR